MSLNTTSNKIVAMLSPLIGKRLNYIGRAANMLDIGFGEDVEFTGLLNKEKRIVSQFVLHVQSSWRIVKQEVIILAHKDFYNAKDEFASEQFQNDLLGNSQFDIRSQLLNNLLQKEPLFISQIIAKDIGDITIHFNSDYRLEVFIDVSGTEESWRFFRMDDDSRHLVIFEDEN